MLVRGASQSMLVGVAAAAAVVAAVTAVLYPLSELDPGVSSGVLYVLGVLLVTTHWGLALGLATSVASALALDFFHTRPAHRFLADEPEDLVAIVVLLITAVVAALIADRARHREAARIHLEEVSASRARVVEAADRERRRVVRDLHDGAQQRLVHAILTLKLARSALGDERGQARELVDEALEQAQDATAELRTLAHGILPVALTTGGLQAGVEALAGRMRMAVTVDVTPDRFPAPVESTAYFVVAEALTNVAKHARAEHAWVSAAPRDGRLEVRVRDDGEGGAAPEGSGLQGLADRVASLGGTLVVESAPGGGTQITASLPSGSAS